MNLATIRSSYPVAFGVAVAVCVAVAVAIVPPIADAQIADLARTGVAALVAGGFYALSGGSNLPAGLGKGAWQRRWPAVSVLVVFGLLAYAVVVSVVLHAIDARGPVSASPASLGLLALSCAATGVFEETLFRGLFFEGFARSFDIDYGVPALVKAAIATSLIFAALHVVQGSFSSVGAVFKFAEATAFGLGMCFLRSRGVSPGKLASLHAIFDFIYFV